LAGGLWHVFDELTRARGNAGVNQLDAHSEPRAFRRDVALSVTQPRDQKRLWWMRCAL